MPPVIRSLSGALEAAAQSHIVRVGSGAFESRGSTPNPLNVRTLKVKEWHYNTSVHTSGFIVDRCTVVYTHVDPVTFLALADEFANAQTGDFVDVYVTVDGIETEVFQGVVKEWRWEENPDGVQMATLETEDRRARLLDTYVPQGTFVRGVLKDPLTNEVIDPTTGAVGLPVFSPGQVPSYPTYTGATFLKVMQLLGALSGVVIDISTFNPPDYVVGPTLSFSGRTSVGTAMARLLKVYQYAILGRVDLIRTGINTYAVKQRPLPPYPDGIVIPAAATRLRKFHRTYVPRILRSTVNGYGTKGTNLKAKCSKNLQKDGIDACTLPSSIIDLSPVVNVIPFVTYRTFKGGKVKLTEGTTTSTTWLTRHLSTVKEWDEYKYGLKTTGTRVNEATGKTEKVSEEVLIRKVHNKSTTIPDYDGFGLCLGEVTTLENDVDGIYGVTRTLHHYQDVVFNLDSGKQGISPGIKVPKPVLTEVVVESIYDLSGSVQTETDPRYGMPLLNTSGGTLRPITYTQEVKQSTDSGAVLKQYEQFVIGGDGFTMVPAAFIHDISPGDGNLIKKPGPPTSAANPTGVVSTSALDSQSSAIQDDMIGAQGDAEYIASLALDQGGQWHIEVEIEMPIDVNIHPHDFITLVDGFVIPGLRNFMVVGISVEDSATGRMTVQAETWAPAPATDWGGLLDPRGGIPGQGTVGAYSGGAAPVSGAIQFLHGTVMSANADGTYEVFVQEEGHVYPSVQVYGGLSNYPLRPQEQVVLERSGMVLYIVN